MKQLVLSMLVALTLGACGWVAPDAGQEAVLIKKPWIWGHGGVEPTPVSAGRTARALSTQVVYVNMQPQQHKEHFEDLMSSDGVPLDFDGYVRLAVTDSVTLIARFGPKWYENNIAAAYRNFVRQAVRKKGMNETAINTTAIDAIDLEVSQRLESYVRQIRIPVKVIDVTVGKANPPDSIKHQRVETAAQEQRVNTEHQRTLAEDARKAAETSRAAADNAYREALGLSPEQFISLEQIKMLQVACSKGGCTFIQPGVGATPTLRLN